MLDFKFGVTKSNIAFDVAMTGTVPYDLGYRTIGTVPYSSFAGRTMCHSQAGHSCFPKSTCLTSRREHFVYAKQSSFCVPKRTSPACSREDISWFPNATILVFHTGHLLCSNHEKCTCHFSVNSADRPGICATYDQEPPNPGTIG